MKTSYRWMETSTECSVNLAILRIVGNNKYGEKVKIFLLNFTHHLLYLY